MLLAVRRAVLLHSNISTHLTPLLSSRRCRATFTNRRGEDQPEDPDTPRDDRSKSSKRGAATSRFRLDDSEFREAFVKGSGPGGQKINKIRSCVQLTHIATGIQVSCYYFIILYFFQQSPYMSLTALARHLVMRNK
jgi:RF-1 domain